MTKKEFEALKGDLIKLIEDFFDRYNVKNRR